MKKIFIGIDFAKEKFDAAIIEACGLKEFGERQFGTFINSKKGYSQFMKWVKAKAVSTTEQEWLLWRRYRFMQSRPKQVALWKRT